MHFISGFIRKSNGQNARWLDATPYQFSDTARHHTRLACTGSCQNQ